MFSFCVLCLMLTLRGFFLFCVKIFALLTLISAPCNFHVALLCAVMAESSCDQVFFVVVVVFALYFMPFFTLCVCFLCLPCLLCFFLCSY